MMNKIKTTLALFAMLFSIGAVSEPVFAANCGKTQTQFISCSSDSGIGAIGDLIKIATLVMTVLIGVVATGGLAYAAVLYTSARDSQSQIDQSKTIIRNVIIGLLLYGFMVAIINWLIPGGVIG